MAKKVKKDYLGLDWIISLILAIFPLTSLILGIYVRIKEGKILAGILRIPAFPIMWILDIVFMIWKGQICRLLDM